MPAPTLPSRNGDQRSLLVTCFVRKRGFARLRGFVTVPGAEVSLFAFAFASSALKRGTAEVTHGGRWRFATTSAGTSREPERLALSQGRMPYLNGIALIDFRLTSRRASIRFYTLRHC